jgi:hypothetical protein
LVSVAVSLGSVSLGSVSLGALLAELEFKSEVPIYDRHKPSKPDLPLRRIHRSDQGECIVLNERGIFISRLQADIPWQFINNQGQAIALVGKSMPAANGNPAYEAPELRISEGGSFTSIIIPHDPAAPRTFTLERASEDGNLLLSSVVKSIQLVDIKQYWLFNLSRKTLTRVRQPGSANESITALSNTRARLLGTGASGQPYQITPDGTCIRLAALPIKISPNATAVALSSLYRYLQATHISPDGRITLTANNTAGQSSVIQLVPNSDSDNDGINDDYEKSIARDLLDLRPDSSEWSTVSDYADLVQGNLNPLKDYTGDGITALQLSNLLAKPPEPGMPTEPEYKVKYGVRHGSLYGWDLVISGQVEPSKAALHLNTYMPGDQPTFIDFSEASYSTLKTKLEEQNYLGYDSFSNLVLSDPGFPILPWFIYTPDGSDLNADVGMTSGTRFQIRPRGRDTSYEGEILQQRLQIYATNLKHEPFSRTYLKITSQISESESHYFDEVFKDHIINVEVKEVKIPRGKLLPDQDWLECVAPYKAGYVTNMSMPPVEVVPDYNRDGMINDEDRGKATEEKPFVFWTNDDDDENAEPHFGDIPGTQVDGADMLVNDARDLVDFFPVQLQIKEVLAALPSDKYTYEISHPTGAFHFIEMPDVHPDSSPEAQGAGSYLRNPTMADDAMARPMNDTAGQGSELTAEYLNAAKDGMGVLLFEAKSATNQSFELIITKKSDSTEVGRITRAMPVEIVDVEKMFWRANIRPAAYGQTPGAIVEPESAKFKATRKERWFVFCHGYNVSEEAARGWNAEVFKRLHQMGSDSKFLGVTWEGNQGRLGANTIIPFEGGFAPDYWRNVYNAFSSSHALATFVTGLSGGGKVVAGHSLGNMIMGSAICDKGLIAEKYFMLNAAVPREAYFPNHIATDRNSVSNPNYQRYPTRLWSSDWKTLFTAPGDGRAKLTWQGRFGDLATKTTPYNYYSMGEDVAKSGNGTYPNALFDVALKNEWAWVAQEMNKGLATKAVITGAGAGNWSANGGWSINPNHYQQYRPSLLNPFGINLPDTSVITNAQLMGNPFFKPFTKLTIQNGGAVPDSANGVDLASSQGSAHASNYAVKAWLLAHDVPAISQPAASNPINEIDGKDMNGVYKTGNWGDWKHSDLKEQPLNGVWKLFKEMVTRGDLKK